MKYEKMENWIDSGRIDIKFGPAAKYFRSEINSEKGRQVIKVKNIGYGSIVVNDIERVDENDVSKLESFLVEENDILLARKGMIYRHALISNKEQGWIQGTDAVRLRINTDQLNPKYLSYYFLSKEFRNNMLASVDSTKVTVASLNKRFVRKIIFPCVDRNEQDRIVEVLEKYDRKIELNKKIINNLSEQSSLLYTHMFSKRERKTSLEEIAIQIIDGEHNSVQDDPEGKYFYLSCKNLRDEEIYIGESERRINKIEFERIRKRTGLKKGDILLGSVGRSGKIVMLEQEPDYFEFQRSVAIVHPDLNKVSSEYLFFALKSIRQEIINLAFGTAQQFIRLSNLRQLKVYLPAEHELREFDQKVQPLRKLITQKREENRKYSEIRDALIEKLIIVEK